MTQQKFQKEWYADVPRSTKGPTIYGFTAIIFALGGFGLWSGTAPIAGAVVANGVFVTDGQNKTVQHLEGVSSRRSWSVKATLSGWGSL